MGTVYIEKKLLSCNRSSIRNEVVGWFLNENPGMGKGEFSSKAIYTVDSYQGINVELHRPASLNKGFDFTVNVSGIKFKKKKCYTAPSHDDIFAALKCCKNNDPIKYESIIRPIINDIYNCHVVNFSPTSAGAFVDYLGQNRPIEIILLCLKWLFIEQDITYWNWSGRNMLFEGLKSNDLI